MIGPLVNGAALVVGTLGGATIGSKVPERIRHKMPMIFGLASMGLGLAMTVRVKYLPATILALLLGSILGEIIDLEHKIQKVAGTVKGLVERFAPSIPHDLTQEEYMEQFIALLILFCASGTGIFGSINEGITGDASMLIVKSFLDLFTAGIFTITLGLPVIALVIPQMLIQVLLFSGAQSIMPLTTPDMIADFSAVGGLIMFATGFRICGIMSFPTANMLPALLLVMPFSHLWMMYTG